MRFCQFTSINPVEILATSCHARIVLGLNFPDAPTMKSLYELTWGQVQYMEVVARNAGINPVETHNV